MPAKATIKSPPESSLPGSRIRAWVDTIAPGTPEAPPPSKRRKRCPQEEGEGGNLRPAKRKTRAVLGSTTGNIMDNKENRDSPGRRTARHTPLTPAKPSKEADDDPTPRPRRQSKTKRHGLAGLGKVPEFRPSAESSQSSDSGIESLGSDSRRSPSRVTTSSRRSESPSKKCDLYQAERAVSFPTLNGEVARQAGGLLVNYAALRAIGWGHGVIPTSLKKSLEDYVDKDDRPLPHFYKKNPGRTYDGYVWRQITDIHEAASECKMIGSSEGGWNHKVHGPLLKIVVADPKYEGTLSYHDVTSARIGPQDLYIKNVSGAIMGGKKVDFVIGLTPNANLRKKIRDVLSNHPPESQSLNQTSQPSLRNIVVYLNIETKPPSTGGEKAEVQLATWGYAGFTKLHQLLDAAGRGEESLPVMPLLSVHGHDWALAAIREVDGETHVLEDIQLGTTSSIEGIFQIILALDLLVNWSNIHYRKWYFTKVLGLKDGKMP